MIKTVCIPARYFVFIFVITFFCGCASSSKTGSKFNLKDVTFDQNTYPAVILGGGVGGLTAAVYLGQAGLEPIVIEGDNPGGLITQSNKIRNWPGEIKISGHDLSGKIREQAIKLGTKILKQKVLSVDFSVWPYKIQVCNITDEEQTQEIKALSCIIVMGTKPNLLNIPGEIGVDGYFGKGVSTCAICDGALYKDKIVAVVGGGNSAMDEAVYLSNLAKKVFIVVRSDKLRASHLQQALVHKKNNIEILFNKKIIQINGDEQHVTSIMLEDTKQDVNGTNAVNDLAVDGVFLAIGSTPNTQALKDQIKLDKNGFIKLYKYQETSKHGIFAAGDIADKKFKQAITAAGDATKCALQCIKFLQKIGYTNTYTQVKPVSLQISDSLETQNVIEIESTSQFDAVLKQAENKLVIADFYATFCVPCQKMAPIFDKLAEKFATQKIDAQCVFIKINISKNNALARQFNLDSVPTFLFFKNGKIIQSIVGSKTYSELEKSILIAVSEIT